MYENLPKSDLPGISMKGDHDIPSEKSSDEYRIAVIWQRFLPYHRARLERLRKELQRRGCRLTSIEVASQDESYKFLEGEKSEGQWITCFPGEVYHRFSASAIHRKVLDTLRQCSPDLVFAPATAFPEGMAALTYRITSGCKVIIMDDAWEMTDKRGIVTRMAKRMIHNLVDGVFIPASSHRGYYTDLNIPEDRIVYGVDVVDNDYFAHGTEAIRTCGESVDHARNFPQRYFLFVGRFLDRKGIDTLIDGFRKYRDRSGGEGWDLLLVGDGQELEMMKRRASGLSGIHFVGRRVGDELLACYAFAKALIVPSEQDPWALVVNEGLASGLPVIVSSGCGSALTLVHSDENGWTFEPGDTKLLTELMIRMSSLPDDKLEKMSMKSREIIGNWSLDRFVQGVLSATAIPRREQGNKIAELAIKFWKGRVSVK